MLKTVLSLYQDKSEYANGRQRLSRLAKRGELVRVIRGLYETDKYTPGRCLAGTIYGPSYLSFEYALSYHGMIPERVYEYSSATFGTGRKKIYHTSFGRFSYRDVPKEVYPLGVILVMEENYSYQIASPEKALCDTLYIKPLLYTLQDMEDFLFEDMRIYEKEFGELSGDDVAVMAQYYGSRNVSLLAKYMRRIKK